MTGIDPLDLTMNEKDVRGRVADSSADAGYVAWRTQRMRAP